MRRSPTAVSIGMVMLLTQFGCTSNDADKAHPYAASVEPMLINHNWQFSTTSDSGYSTPVAIHVPSNWYLEGIDFSGTALYRNQFAVETLSPERRYWLGFDSVDYHASVALNGIPLGEHEGYFSPFQFEVSSIIKAEGNQLNVLVNSGDDPKTEDWSLYKNALKGVLNHHDTRPGGAWSVQGQDANSGGIWGDVWLKSTGDIAVTQLHFQPQLKIASDAQSSSLGQQALTSGDITLSLDSRYQGSVSIELKLTPLNQQTDAIVESYQWNQVVNKGENQIRWTLPTRQRQLWWPYDWGNPSLYQLSVEVLDQNQQVSDSQKTDVGFREFSFKESEGLFYVNGEPYFIRGTNYIGSQWLAEMSDDDYHRDLVLMKQANINSLRVHAHVAGTALYQLADELGFIVWQDFPLQWGYDNSLQTAASAQKQASEMTALLFNHPSIAFWSGHNEPPWDATWMKYKYPSYTNSHNQVLTEAVYQALLAADDGRVVRKASYTHEHPWYGWYSKHYKDYRDIQSPAIISEFGAQAFPNLELVKTIVTDTDSWPLNKQQLQQLNYHNYQHHETTNIAKVATGQSLDDFIVNTQQYQSKVNKYAAEKLRLNKNSGIAAIYQFMFVDSWPAITWAILDVNREAKPAYQALKNAYQPILPVVSVIEDSFTKLTYISVINDSRADFTGLNLIIKCGDSTNNTICWQRSDIALTANKVMRVAKIDISLGDTFTVHLLDKNGKEIAKNSYQKGDY